MSTSRGRSAPMWQRLILLLVILAGFASVARASLAELQIEQVIGGVLGDPTAQAIQMRLRTEGVINVEGGMLVAYDANGLNPVILVQFSGNVPNGNTGDRILVATGNFLTYTAPALTADFIMTNPIPPGYLTAGRIVYASNEGDILWSLAFGGAGYTGPTTGDTINDASGDFGPPFAGPLPTTGTQSLLFQNGASNPSVSNATDYALTAAAAVFTNNAAQAGMVASLQPALPSLLPGKTHVGLQTIATGLISPVDIVPAIDGSGRLFILEQTGQVRLIENGQLSSNLFLDLSGRIVTLSGVYDERGLLSMVFHPGFTDPTSPGYRKLYTFTSEPVSAPSDFSIPMTGTPNCQSVLAEWQVSATNPDQVDTTTRREILRFNKPYLNHNGTRLLFRPSDGYLYFSLGDGGGANDTGDGHNPATGNGQDLQIILGKMIRLDPLDPALTPNSADPVSVNGNYRVPVSNPFVGTSALPEIYAYGLRNVWRYSFDSAPGFDRLIAGDVGQNEVEEVDIVQAGKNYGWHKKEGGFLFDATTANISIDHAPDPTLVEPALQYLHSDGGYCVIGGYVYRGSAISGLTGKYVFADWSSVSFAGPEGILLLGDLDTGAIEQIQIGLHNPPLGLYIKSLSADAAGELYLSCSTALGPSGTTGQILKIVPAPETIAIASGVGAEPFVRTLAPDGQQTSDFLARTSTFRNGLSVAVADVDGDGILDTITGSGRGAPPEVRVYSGKDGSVLFDFMAYDATSKGGVFVAAADLNGDGKADIITGSGSGAPPMVKWFSGADGSLQQSFLAYGSHFLGGVRVAAADVDGLGTPSIITGSGGGAPPTVRIFEANGALRTSYYVYDYNFHGGVFVAAGDVDGDGIAEIITGPGSGSPPLVKVYNATTGFLMKSFMAYKSGFRGGVHVGVADLNGAGYPGILTVPASGASSLINVFDYSDLSLLRSFQAFPATFPGQSIFATGSGD